MASRLHLRPATRVRDVAYLDNHVLDAFGDRPIGRISKEEVQAWIQFLVDGKGLAPRTVRECYRVLASMMREAVDSKLLAESPCRRIALPRIPNNEKRFLSAMEVSRLADCIDPRYRAFVYAGSYLGLRWGELAGLKRINLDLGTRRVRVVGSLERGPRAAPGLFGRCSVSKRSSKKGPFTRYSGSQRGRLAQRESTALTKSGRVGGRAVSRCAWSERHW